MSNLWDSFRQRVVSSVNQFDYAQNPLKVASRFLGGEGDTSDAQIKDMVERVYGPALKRGDVKPWKEGDLESGRVPPIRVAERIDMTQLAADLPQKFNTIVKSEYRPSRGAEKKDKFYSFRDKNQMGQIFKVMYSTGVLQKMKKGKSYNIGYRRDVEKGDADFALANSFVGLERFQVSVGEDKKGKYLAVYDPWDIDKYKWAGSKKIIPGFQFYDRVYFQGPKQKLRKQKTEDNLINVMKRM